jgi:hypothetical protein
MKSATVLCMFLFVLGASPVYAVPNGASLTFDGFLNDETILTYYMGGFGSLGSGPGPAFGITFTPGLVADPTRLLFGPSARITGTSATMNLDSAFLGLVSFYFAGNGTVSFFSGQNGSGTQLSSFGLVSMSLPSTGTFGASLLPFQSAVFTPAVGSTLRLDSISFGIQVVPEPSTAMLLLTGLGLVSIFRRIRGRASKA